MDQSNLTISKAKNEILKLEHQLDVLATKKNIKFLKTQPGAIKLKELVVDSSHTNYDSFLNYVQRSEPIDNEIYANLALIYSYKTFIAKELQRLSKYDEIGYIIYLREEEGKSWREIDRILHHGENYSKVKYSRYKSNQKKHVNSK